MGGCDTHQSTSADVSAWSSRLCSCNPYVNSQQCVSSGLVKQRQQSIIVFIWEVNKAWVLCLESAWKSVPTARLVPRRQNKTKVLSLGGRSPQVTHSCSSQGQEGQHAEERRGCRCLGAWLVQGSSVSDSQETRVRHTSGEGQGAADVFDSRSLDGQAVGSGAPQHSWSTPWAFCVLCSPRVRTSFSIHVWKAATPWSQAEGKRGGGPATCLTSNFSFPRLWGLRPSLTGWPSRF